ncbi:MAG TPA: CxxxxCH/CxxCH domain-containing protein [Desulfuromonadaceae bacterium]
MKLAGNYLTHEALPSLPLERIAKWFGSLSVSIATILLMAATVHASLSCDRCHTMPPTDSPTGNRDPLTGGFKGSHAGHSGASTNSCTPCHGAGVTSYTAAHSTQTLSNKNSPIIKLTSKIHNYSTANGRSQYSRGIFFNQTTVPPIPLGTCSNVNCHFEKSTPAWGSTNFASPNDCNKCHGAPPSGTTTGAAGSHAKHDQYYPGTSNCRKCHPNNTTFLHATSAGGRNLAISFAASPNNGNGNYSGPLNDYLPSQTNVFGTCTNVYCHSNGQRAMGNLSTNTIPTWGGSLPGNCTGCHRADNASGTIMNSGSHAKHLNLTSYIITCSKCHAATVSGMTIIDTNAHVNGAINIKFNSLTTAVSGTYAGQAAPMAKAPGSAYSQCSNVSCHFNTTTPTWGTKTPISCLGCHSLAVLLASGSHAKHISATATPTMYNYTANRSTATEYDFGCSCCHPLDIANHMNGTINVTLSKTNPGAGGMVGSLRSKNGATANGLNVVNSGTIGTTKVSVRCTATYCHSNGNTTNLIYATTPDWYGGTFTGDRCANCHGNSPNSTIAGSKSHYNNRFLGYTSNAGGHQIGIHAMNIYSSPGGLAKAGTTGDSSHGNAASSTTISCNICHYLTVTTARNDNNVVCKTCHYAGNSVGALVGNPAAIADKSRHVNGNVDIAFKPTAIISKAQMRPASFASAPYSSVWKRNLGYKVSGSSDSGKTTLNTATMWNSSTKTCSNVACHNGQSVSWSDNNGATNCVSCHTAL